MVINVERPRENIEDEESLEACLAKKEVPELPEDTPITPPSPPPPPGIIGIRHLQALLYVLALLVGYGFRYILSVGIVAMTDPKVNSNPDVPAYPEWTNKNVILSAFFWAYFMTQIFAGWAASRFGAKWILVVTVGLTSLFGCLIPLAAAGFGSKGVILCRVMQGLCEGFLYPCITHLMSAWVPEQERTRMSTMIYTCGTLASIVTSPITGLICGSRYGWPMTFYFYAVLGFVWCLLMGVFGYETPAIHPYITFSEKVYIQRNSGRKHPKKQRTPWKQIFTSKPVWALAIWQVGHVYSFWTFQTVTPSYIHHVMQLDIEKNGYLSSLPHVLMWLLALANGPIVDWLINERYLGRGAARKMFTTLGLLLSVTFTMALAYATRTTAVIFLVLTVASTSLYYSGAAVNVLDITVNHAGTVLGIYNSIGQSTSSVPFLVMHLVVTDPTDTAQWRSIFFITAAVGIVTTIVYDLLGSGEVQSWDHSERIDEE